MNVPATPALKTALGAGLWAGIFGPVLGSLFLLLFHSESSWDSSVLLPWMVLAAPYSVLMFGPAAFAFGMIGGLAMHEAAIRRGRKAGVAVGIVSGGVAGFAAAWLTSFLYPLPESSIVGAISGAVTGGTFASWQPTLPAS